MAVTVTLHLHDGTTIVGDTDSATSDAAATAVSLRDQLDAYEWVTFTRAAAPMILVDRSNINYFEITVS
jgi:hypothetical protein